MKTLILLSLGIFITISALATSQVPDVLYYHGDTLDLFNNPLEDYFNEKITRPDYFFGDDDKCLHTACWRGYVAHWKIENDSLFLVKIEDCCRVKYLPLTELFSNGFNAKSIFAGWYSGELLVPKGDLIYYRHMGYQSIYEFELTFSLQNGVVLESKMFDNSMSVLSEYEQNTNKRNEFIYRNLNWEKLPKLREAVSLNFNIQADSIGNIIMASPMSVSTYEPYSEEIVRVLYLIPQWSAIFKRGEFIPMRSLITVQISPDIRKKYQ